MLNKAPSVTPEEFKKSFESLCDKAGVGYVPAPVHYYGLSNIYNLVIKADREAPVDRLNTLYRLESIPFKDNSRTGQMMGEVNDYVINFLSEGLKNKGHSLEARQVEHAFQAALAQKQEYKSQLAAGRSL